MELQRNSYSLASDDAEYVTGTANIIDGGNIIPETGVMGTE